jgi:FkbM family methyltransferase
VKGRRFTINLARTASFVGRKLPRLSSVVLRALGPVLPNIWAFYFMVGECGAKVSTSARLGNGMKVKVFLGDMIGCHIWDQGWYEPHVVETLKSFLHPDVTFFDVGANVGQYTLLSAPLVQEVHSFEPVPKTYELLSWNVHHNRMTNVHLNQVAVSDRAGEVVFFEGSANNVGGTSLRQAVGNDRIQQATKTITLDEYVFASDVVKRLRRVVVKMDIEGAELLALNGAKEFLKLRPVLVLESIDDLQRNFGNSVEELVTFLAARGYTVRSLEEDGPGPYNRDCHNILALP